MTWTFDPANPTDRDRVRLLITDIEVTKQRISDEVLDMLIEEAGTKERAAVRACRIIASDYTTKAAVTIGPLSVSYGEQSAYFTDLALQIERDSRRDLGNVATPFSGTADQAEDPINFRIGMHDHPEDIGA
jgi:hypothetical protein